MRFSTYLTVLVGITITGCSEQYKGPIKPAPKLSYLSPELESLSEPGMSEYLNADIKPEFPTNLAIARLGSPQSGHGYYSRGDESGVAVVAGEEADGWRNAMSAVKHGNSQALAQVNFLNSLLVPPKPTLKQLRDGAAMLRAPLLLVYTQDDTHAQGYNPAAMAYWSIIGLFLVPGNTVGHHSACSGVLMETRTGVVLATFDGDKQCEENVLAGAVDIASDRVRNQAQRQAVVQLQKNAAEVIANMAAEATARKDD